MTSEHTGTDTFGGEAWLQALRREPSARFKAQLRERLRAQEPAPLKDRVWPRRVLAAAAAIVVMAVLMGVPRLRASVAQFVSLFRVVNVVGVPVDSRGLERLESENLDIDTLIGENVQVLQDPGPPIAVLSLADAAAASGMTLALPQWLPRDTQIMEMAVVGERVVRVTADGQRLQQVMEALGITDLTVPPGLDGQIVNVRVPPVVMVRYDHQNKRRTRLFQARTPQLTLPDSIDLEALGEIGLRILGLPAAEAKQFAGAIDWHSTLIVPVPPNATVFQQVDIGGHRGVLIQHQPRDQSPTVTIIWSTADRVCALVSIEPVADAMAMATSVR